MENKIHVRDFSTFSARVGLDPNFPGRIEQPHASFIAPDHKLRRSSCITCQNCTRVYLAVEITGNLELQSSGRKLCGTTCASTQLPTKGWQVSPHRVLVASGTKVSVNQKYTVCIAHLFSISQVLQLSL